MESDCCTVSIKAPAPMRTTPMLITTMLRVWLANNVGSDDHVDSEVNYGKCDRRDGGYDGGMLITVARTMVTVATLVLRLPVTVVMIMAATTTTTTVVMILHTVWVDCDGTGAADALGRWLPL